MNTKQSEMIEYTNGDRVWYFEGKLHRTDGPAVEHANGGLEWWVDGTEISEEELTRQQIMSLNAQPNHTLPIAV